MAAVEVLGSFHLPPPVQFPLETEVPEEAVAAIMEQAFHTLFLEMVELAAAVVEVIKLAMADLAAAAAVQLKVGMDLVVTVAAAVLMEQPQMAALVL
jgi:hypothetical protein